MSEEIDWQGLTDQATRLFVNLREAQRECKGTIQAKKTSKLAAEIDHWCRFVEDNSDKFTG